MPDFIFPEGSTPIAPEEAHGLLLTHITTRGELDRWEQDNIIEALAWLYKTKPKDILQESFTRELHKRMFGNVWRWAGSFRKSDKNLGIAWQQIPVSMRNLLDDTRFRIQLGKDDPDEIAIRFHHRLVSIHPFANGNGRHARLMADVLLENVFSCTRFTWGSAQELSKSGETRAGYIAALRDADNGSYESLLAFARS
jgi:Fic-DOC domain mobile mystery protein B